MMPRWDLPHGRRDKEEKMKWGGFELPNDPGPTHKAILRVWYAIEDWWRGLDGEERALLGLVLLAMALMIITLGSPHKALERL